MTRLLIALGLVVGIAVFAVYTIEELKAGVTTYAPPTDFGAADTSPPTEPTPSQGPNALAGLTTTDTSKFIPILRENPHPGKVVPFMNAAPFGQAPYRQPTAGNEVWELCAYRVTDASLTDLVAHYDQQAKQRGMKLNKQRPTSDRQPGGIISSWTKGQERLEVTAWPMPSQPATPPLAPKTPLQWVVKYSYPDQP